MSESQDFSEQSIEELLYPLEDTLADDVARRVTPGTTILPNILGGAIYAPSFDHEKFAVAVRMLKIRRSEQPDVAESE